MEQRTVEAREHHQGVGQQEREGNEQHEHPQRKVAVVAATHDARAAHHQDDKGHAEHTDGLGGIYLNALRADNGHEAKALEG